MGFLKLSVKGLTFYKIKSLLDYLYFTVSQLCFTSDSDELFSIDGWGQKKCSRVQSIAAADSWKGRAAQRGIFVGQLRFCGHQMQIY